MTTTVSMAMDAQPPVIRLGSSIGETFAVMQAAGASVVYVVDDDDRLHGVVPDYELLKGRLLGLTVDAPVMPLICWSVNSLPANASLEQAAVQLRSAACREIAIVRDDRLIGRLNRELILASLFPAPAAPAEPAHTVDEEVIEEPAKIGEPATEAHHGPEIAAPRFLRTPRANRRSRSAGR